MDIESCWQRSIPHVMASPATRSELHPRITMPRSSPRSMKRALDDVW
ncbi:hypothetical protein MXAN_7429 [Myxococcus xanthus DK 1622]|uniref:Uncharacterized protein n=1 Tax=Myxococcus xanthus (strain DK1622) TaxID=246197 RepID=Q1CVN9_MYXXD|nr:hypothetical protein MXAN_7429 [Myxococcus xanthus DK 1622]